EEWFTPERTADIPMAGGEEYHVVSLDQPLTTTIGSGPMLCEPSQTPVMEFFPPLPGEFGGVGAIAMLASWQLRPRAVVVSEQVSADHRQAAIDVIDSMGIDDPDPPVTQSITVDLDGDGLEEVVLVLQRLPDDLIGHPGDYSVVLFRKVIEGEWRTAIVERSTGVADSPYILSHSIPAVADLNGDGPMEIVVDAAYYEGAGTVAYEYLDDDLGLVAVISGGCGA
ncbi:MAG: FG-GAP repeat domain-containing protein, partial [Acidimicrobiia bacterium]